MPERLRQRTWFCLTMLVLAATTGCVERRLVIASDPYGAVVYDEKNQPIGASPADHPFTYYGTYQFRIAKDGYETLVVQEKIRAPWYEWAGLDFISENLVPFTIRDVRYLNYTLQRARVESPDVVLKNAEALRAYGSTKGPPLPEPTLPPTPPNASGVLLPPTP